MEGVYEQERREFIRVKVEIPVRYKFLAKHRQDAELNTIYEGFTTNLSGGGLLLMGKLPVLAWLADLLMQKMAVGINLYLPLHEAPIKALTRVAWIETIEEQTQRTAFGLKFREITADDKDKIFRFVIKAQLPS